MIFLVLDWECFFFLIFLNIFLEKGELYTWGCGSYGALGHNDGDKNHINPKLVDFFSKNNLKVKDVALGESHSMALTGLFKTLQKPDFFYLL